MAVARDAVLEFATFTTTSPATLSFTPTGTPRGVVVHIVLNANVLDTVTAVTYGGVAMRRIVTTFETAGSGTQVWTYFLGAGIPTGPQTVSITHGGTVQTKWAIVQSFTAAADTEAGTDGMIFNGGAANPLMLLDSGAISAIRTGIFHTSHDAIGDFSPLAGMEALTTSNTHDFGGEVAVLAQQSTASTGVFNLGFTATTSAFAMVGITVQEVVSNGFPQAEAATLTRTTSGSIAVKMPPVVDAGDLLLIFYGSISQTVTTPGGWTLLSTADNGYELNIYYKVADGSEGGTTVTLTGSVGVGSAQSFRVTNWHGTTPPEAGTAATGTSTTPDPPNLIPSWGAEDTLWIAASNGGFNGTPVITDYPDSFDNGAHICSNGTQVSLVGTARRWFNGASVNPATFTMSGSAQWVAQTVAVRPAAAPTVPTAPTNLAATAISGTQIDLAWDDNATDETSFRVERSLTGVGGWSTVGTPAADEETFSNTGLTCETEYFYRVFAVNAVGDSLPSNTDSAITSACPPPPTPSGNRMGGTGAVRKPPR